MSQLYEEKRVGPVAECKEIFANSQPCLFIDDIEMLGRAGITGLVRIEHFE